MSVTYKFERFSFEFKCLTAWDFLEIREPSLWETWEDEEDTHLKEVQFVNINLSSVDF